MNLAQQIVAWSLSLPLAFLSTAWSPRPSFPQLPTLPPRPDWALYLKEHFVFGNYNNKTLPKKVTDFLLIKK